MPEEMSFRELLQRVRAGEADATRELALRYEPHIRRAANRPLNDLHLRNLLDSMDICQAVLAEFFVRAADGQFELTEPDELLRLFVTMARNQVLDESRHHKAGRRDHRRQQTDLSEHCLGGIADDEPTPSGIVSARELIEEVSRRLSAEERDLLEQRALRTGVDHLGGAARHLRRHPAQKAEPRPHAGRVRDGTSRTSLWLATLHRSVVRWRRFVKALLTERRRSSRA